MTIDARHYHLDHNILDHGKNRKHVKDQKEHESQCKRELDYMKKCYKADLAIAQNPTVAVKHWRNYDDIKAYLQPLKKDKEET